MHFDYTAYMLPSLLGGLAAGGMAAYAWRQQTRTARAFAVFALAGVVWALGNALEVAGADLATKLWWAKVEYVGIAVAPVAWTAFALQYTGREKWLTRRSSLPVAVVPALTLLLIFTNESHGWFWSAVSLDVSGPFVALRIEPGLGYVLNFAYAYALYLLGSFLILLSMVRAPHLYRQQSLILLLGLFIPWIGNLVYLTRESRVPHLDLTPMAFAFSALAVAWGVFRFRLLDLLPVARETLVDASGDGLIALDARNRVVDLNPAAQQILGRKANAVIGQPATGVLAFRPDLLSPASLHEPGRGEVTLGPEGQAHTYDLFVSPLTDPQGHFTGRLIALRDITDLKRTEAELRAQKQLFENLVAVARATAEGPTLQATLQNALNVAATLTGAERGSLFLLNQAGEVTHSLLTYGGIAARERQNIVRRVMDHGLAGWVVRHRQAVLVADTTRDERWLASASHMHPVGSALAVPILSGSALAGVLTLTHSRPNSFTDEHLRLMQAAADQMALALRNAQIFESQRQMAQRQAMLYGLLRSVGEQLDPQSVARAAVDAIVQLVDTQARWPAVSIALLERDRQTWMNYAARGHLSPTVGLRYRLNQGIIGRTFRTGRPQHVPEVLNDPDYVEGNASTRSELAVPVRHGESVLGVLNLESDQPNGYTPDDMLLAESLADAVALALDNANLYQTVSDERSRLQALIESSRDGILMVSRDYRLLVVNAPVLQLLRLPGQPDDWVGRPVTGLFLALRRQAPRVARAFVREVRRLERGDEPSAEGEAEVPPRVLYWLSLPVLAGAEPLGRLLVLRDVSEARLLQKLRDELTDTLVHDLRNPLTNIRMALELVEQVSAGVANEQQQSAMHIARLSTDRMLALVNAILDVSRLEAGQMPVKREALALPGLVADVFVQQQPLAQEKQLHLCNAVPPSLPAVPADPNLMRRVLENLVGNAVKFVPDGGQIQVSAVAEDGQVVVTVRDDGPGLSPEMRANVFQRFVTGRHHAHGTGLGLAFCRLAVEAHGGRIWVDSEPGRGAAFCFALPLGENGR